MLQRVEIAFGGTVFVCTVCGASGSLSSLARCRDAGAPEPPPLRVGDVVTMYWKEWSGSGTVRKPEPEQFTVRRLSYEAPMEAGFRLAMMLARTIGSHVVDTEPEPPIHTLRVGLAQTLDGKPYVEGASGYSSVTISYEELVLWQEGDSAKLAAAKLIHPPRVRPAGRWYQRLFGG